MKNIKILVYLMIFTIATFFGYTTVNADAWSNINVWYNGDGVSHGGAAGAGTAIMDKYYIRGCVGVKVNLVKLTDHGPEWVTFYYLMVDNGSRMQTTNYKQFSNASYNPVFSPSGEPGVYGQIRASGYDFGAFATKILKTSEMGMNGSSFTAGDAKWNFSQSNLKSTLNNEDMFFKVVYEFFTNVHQGNSAVPYEHFDKTKFNSPETLKTYLKDPNNAEVIKELQDYRIIFEPIWNVGVDSPRSIRLFMTTKALANLMINSKHSMSKDNLRNTAYISDTSTSGTITNKGTELSDMIDVNNIYGYIMMNIVGEVKECDPKVSCCYSADGTYNATPINPPENASTYRCEGTVNDDKTCSEEVKQCSTPLKEGVCKDDEEGPFYNYYMFLASMEKDSINNKALTMHTTAENAEFKDKEIFEKLVKDLDPTLNYSLNYIRVLDDASGVVSIDSSNYSDFYSKLKQARETPNSYFQAGNDYYITHTKWCSVDASGKTTCTDTAKLEESTSYYMNRSIYTKTLDIKKMKNAESTGYTFDLVRTWDKGLENQTFMSNTPTKDSGKLYHPAEYRIAYCITKKEEPNCDDEVNPASCVPGGTKPIFRESDDLKTCTIKKDNNSGFVAIDKTSDIDQTETGKDTSKYCTMACKEDLDIELPGEKETAAGQYFKLDEYTPKISAKRTCVTTEIKYSDFDNDLKAIEATNMPKQFNTWHDYYEISEHLNGGQASANEATNKAQSEASTRPSTEYSVERKTCTIATSRIEEYCKAKVGESDNEALEKCKNSDETKNHTEEYLLETYKANGKEYKYVAAGGIYCNDDERSGYGAVKNSSGSWDGLSNDTSLSKDQQALSYEDRTGKTYTEKLVGEQTGGTPSASSGSDVGRIKDFGSSSCTITSADGKSKSEYDYTWESWEVYSYKPALSSETGVTYSGRTGLYISNPVCRTSDDQGTTYAVAVRQEFGTQSGIASRKSNEYYETLRKYQETINNFNRCFNWIDTTKDYDLLGYPTWKTVGYLKPFDQNGRYEEYNYEFEPSVSYWYQDEKDRVVFEITEDVPYKYDYKKTDDGGFENGYGYVEKAGFQTEMAYWKGSAIDEKYTGGTKTGSFSSGPGHKGQNSEDREIITCPPDAAKCTSGDTTDTPFYRSSYLKRIESVSYTYHLPRVVSSIPDGKVHLKHTYPKTGAKPTVTLDLDASPVNINTREGPYKYKLTISKLKDELRARKSGDLVKYNDINDNHEEKTANGDGTNPDDDFEDRFINGTAKTDPALTDGSEYICNYRVINDIYVPDPPKLNFFYRIIDPANINPNGRQLGYNWVDTRAQSVIERMKGLEDNYQELIDEDNGTFEFTLTPLIMKQIRAYNAKETNSGGYADWDLECHDYEDERGNPDSQGYHCYSTFLTCLSSKGNPGDNTLDCQGIFGSSLNATNYNPEYDLDKLDDNRGYLLAKQKALDCSNNNAFLNKACGG